MFKSLCLAVLVFVAVLFLNPNPLSAEDKAETKSVEKVSAELEHCKVIPATVPEKPITCLSRDFSSNDGNITTMKCTGYLPELKGWIVLVERQENRHNIRSLSIMESNMGTLSLYKEDGKDNGYFTLLCPRCTTATSGTKFWDEKNKAWYQNAVDKIMKNATVVSIGNQLLY